MQNPPWSHLAIHQTDIFSAIACIVRVEQSHHPFSGRLSTKAATEFLIPIGLMNTLKEPLLQVKKENRQASPRVRK
jgi:hypothetical protein